MLADGERGDFVLVVHSLRLFAATAEVDAAAGFQHAKERFVLCEYAGERLAEGVNGTFKALQHVDDHEVLERVLAPLLVDRAAAPRVRRREVVVVLLAAGENIHRRRIDAERARDERVVEFLDLNGVRIGRYRTLLALRGKMGRELPDGGRVVEPLDVLAGAGNRHGVEEFEEVRRQHLEKRLRRPGA